MSAAYTNRILVYLNGEKHELSNVHPHTTLQDWLHQVGLTGTKVSCAQGGCGACTVTIAQYSPATSKVTERAVNACLRPLLLCDGCAVTTVEGIGNASKPHPVQERIAVNNGSQCGFCTPGQVMSMYGLLREKKCPSVQEVEACLEGNICRCTGYRGIHAAAHTFAGQTDCTNVPGYPKEFAAYTGEGEPTFPQDLITYRLAPLCVKDQDGTTKWYRVGSLEQWVEVCNEAGFRKPRVVVGNTSVGVFGHKVGALTNVDLSAVPELNGVRSGEDGIVVGGAESLTTLIEALRGGNAAQQTLAGSMSKIANANVRNAGGWAGNLVMGRVIYFPSDGAVLLSAFGAEVTVAVVEGGKLARKTMLAADFVHDTDLNNYNYALVSIRIPAVESKFHAFRHSPTKANCHASVNAAFRTDIVSGKFKNTQVVFGCIGKRAVISQEANKFLEGKPVADETLQGLLEIVRTLDVEKDSTYTTELHPEGQTEFKRQVLLGFVFKWFASLSDELPADLASIASKAEGFEAARHPAMQVAQQLSSTGQLSLPAGHPGSTYVGPKKEAFEQACGQLRYSGDMEMGPRGVHGVFVTATRIGKLLGVDASAALKQEGVLQWVDAADVPGMNSSSLVPGEEPLFAEVGKDLLFVGQIVGVLVARTHQQAKTASRMVQLQIGDSDVAPVFSIDEAVAKKSFLYGPDFEGKKIQTGDVDKAFADANNIIVEGDVHYGGQNNFCMEKHTCVAMPDDMGRIAIYGGAQTPDATKSHVMVAMGCSSKDLVLKIRPMGGAFGGKFTRQYSTFCASAVCCKALGRPVRIAMNLHQDMGCAGHTRHVMKCHYKVAATREGKIVAIDNTMMVDAGCSNDYTDYMVDEILKRQDMAYHIPNYRGVVNMVKTNNPTASAVRAPGLAQANVVAETMIDAVARALKLPQEMVREVSMKPSVGARDQTGQEITEWNLPDLWQRAKAKFDFAGRERMHNEFNAQNRFKKRAAALMPLKYHVGYVNMSGLSVTVNINAADGTVAIQTGCCEMGQGCLTKVLSTCACEFGIPVDKVSAFYPDTSVLPNLQTDGGSAGSEILCQATKSACDELKARLKPVEEALLDEKRAAAEDKAAAVSATWEEICARAFGPMPTDTRVNLSATTTLAVPKWNDIRRSPDHPPPPVPWWNLDPLPADIWQYYVTGVACSDVEVDVLTGEYTILRSDVVMDAGHSLNPLLDLGQAEGGFVYGIGAYCTEEVLMDPKDGRNKSEGTWNYKVPGNKDVPRVFNVELEPGNPSSRTLYGSKGVGEAPLLLAYSVVAAVQKAVLASRLERGLAPDFRLDSPATADRVQRALDVRAADLSLAKFAPPARG